MGQPEVAWTQVALRLPDDGTGALPLLRHVILNDQTSATYKLGLLRALCRAADSAAVLAQDDGAENAAVPLGLVALNWLRLYLPLVTAVCHRPRPIEVRMAWASPGRASGRCWMPERRRSILGWRAVPRSSCKRPARRAARSRGDHHPHASDHTPMAVPFCRSAGRDRPAVRRSWC
jgi:hypothetical protein